MQPPTSPTEREKRLGRHGRGLMQPPQFLAKMHPRQRPHWRDPKQPPKLRTNKIRHLIPTCSRKLSLGAQNRHRAMMPRCDKRGHMQTTTFRETRRQRPGHMDGTVCNHRDLRQTRQPKPGPPGRDPMAPRACATHRTAKAGTTWEAPHATTCMSNKQSKTVGTPMGGTL